MQPVRRVALIGGAGFLGRHVAAGLAARGLRPRIVARRPGAVPASLGEAVGGDVRDARSIVDAVAGMDAAVNFVGIMRETGGQSYEAVHVDGARTVAQAAGQAGLGRLLHLSALGIAADAPSRADRSKAAGEAAVRNVFPDATLVRPSVVYGPDDHFLAGLARLVARIPVLPLVGGGATLFQPIHVTDAAATLVAGLLEDGTKRQAVALAGPDTLSLRRIVEMLLRAMGRRRRLPALPFPLAALLARPAGMLPASPLTLEQVRLLRTDKVAGPGDVLPETLGIRPGRLADTLPAVVAEAGWR